MLVSTVRISHIFAFFQGMKITRQSTFNAMKVRPCVPLPGFLTVSRFGLIHFFFPFPVDTGFGSYFGSGGGNS
jgi:hypothetical protein